jgi:hypothetical protein
MVAAPCNTPQHGAQFANEPTAGWSFDEALERTSDPRAWDRYQAERRGHSTTSAGLLRSLVDDLVAKVGNQLVAAGHVPAGDEEGWIILDRAALEKKIASQRTDQVRLFAPLKAPNAAAYLKDLGLGEAFRRYLLGDPEIAVLIHRSGTQDRFEGGQCPLALSDYHWPLHATATNFEFRLTEGVGLLIIGGPELRPTREVSALSAALADRLVALRSRLASGNVQAFGITRQFVETLVPARVWGRTSLSIDVANGDLCEEDDRGHFSTLWTNVELRCPTPEADAPHLIERATSTRKRHPKGQEVERIIRERQIDVGKLGPKNAAAAVARYMTHPPVSGNDMRALEKQVARISKIILRPR